jgi:hypothetical protein
MLDGGLEAQPALSVEAWLVTDERAELIGELRRLAAGRGLRPEVTRFDRRGLSIIPRPVAHTRTSRSASRS